MPLTFDESDFKETGGGLTFSAADFAPSLEELEAGPTGPERGLIAAEAPYFGTGQRPFDPISGGFLGPSPSPEQQVQFMKGAVDLPLAVPGALIGAGEKLLSLPIGWMQRNLPTVVNYPTDQERFSPAEREVINIERQSRGEPPLPTPPTQADQNIRLVTPQSQGITPETPAVPMPAESEKGILPAAQRFISPMTSSVGAAQLPFFEFKPVRALYAAGAAASIPESIQEMAQAKTPAEFREAATKGVLSYGAARALTSSLTKGEPYAPQERQVQEGVPTKRPGDDARRAPAEAGAGGGLPPAAGLGKEAQVPLSKDEQAYLDAEREGLDVGVDVHNDPVSGKNPFAGEVATIDRQNDRIVIRPEAFKQWLAAMPEEQRPQAVKSLLSEERIHLLTDDESALGYWNNLTAAEKLINQRRYTGSWVARGGPRGGIDDVMLGHEALRFRMQQLTRMTPREIAEASGRERWTVQGLTAVESVIRTIREKLGTKASGTQRAILDRMMGNLATAKFVASGGAQPSAMLKEYEDDAGKKFRPEDYGDNDIKFTVMKFPEMPQMKGAVQADSVKNGVNEWSTNPNDLRQNGFKVPSSEEMLQKLPPGQYTLGQVKEMLAGEPKVYNLDEAAADLRKQTGREFVAAIKDSSGKVTEGYSHDDLRRSGITGTPGFTDPQGNFLTALEVARRKMGQSPFNPSAIRKRIEEERQLGFKFAYSKTDKEPTPGSFQSILFRGDRGDTRAVVRSVMDGTKPAALWHSFDAPHAGDLLGPAIERGDLALSTDKFGYEILYRPTEEGIKARDKITELHGEWIAGRLHGNDWFRQLGTALGYTSDEINEFIHRSDRIDWSGPAAIRKKQMKQSGQEELFLPPILPEEAPKMERGGYAVPSANVIESDAADYLKRFREGAEKLRRPPAAPGPPLTANQQREGVALPRPEPKEVVPSFDEFKGFLESKYGAIGREKLYYLWQDSITKHLMEATGAELSDMVQALGLKRDVGEAMKPSSRDPYIGKIPDVMTKEEMDNQIEYVRKMFSKKPWITMEEFKRKFGLEIARKFSEPFQRRYAAIGAILDEMTKRAGEKPSTAWDRKEIGPEDIMQGYVVTQAVPASERMQVEEGGELSVKPEVEARRLVRAVPLDIIKDPKAVGEMVTQGAAVEASGKGAPPRTVSRNVVAMRGPNGNIVLVSAWKDPRKGPKVTDPTAPTLPGKTITADLLSKWEPLQVMTLREPVQKFFRSFKDQNEFDRWFGDVGIEGTTGLRTSSVVGPIADIYRAQTEAARATRPPAAEELPAPPRAQVSPYTRELTSRRSFPPTVTPGEALPKGPAPAPAPIQPEAPAMLSPEERAFVESESQRAEPPLPSLYEEIAKVHQFKPTAGGKAYVTSRPQFVIKGKGGLILGPRTRTEPLALNKQRINDETFQLFKSLKALIGRRDVKQHLPRILDGMERAGDQYARQVGDAIRLKSFGQAGQMGLPSGERAPTRKEMLKEATTRREAAKAMIASTARESKSDNPIPLGTFSPNSLDRLMKDVESGIVKAELWQVSRNPVERLWANKWLKAAQRLKSEIDYARKNWDDPQLQATALQILKEGKDEIDFENANGFNVTERQFYIPGRYEGEFWNDKQVSFSPLGLSSNFLGEQFRGGKKFRDYYEAIRHGPYLPASYDPALIMESRVRAGRYRAAQTQAFDFFKSIKDPVAKDAIAKEPRMVPREDAEGNVHYEYFPPSPEYRLVYPSENKRGVPLAVKEPYYNAVRSLTRTSQLVDIPGGRELLLGASMLKHGWLMIGDLFHGSRLGQYGITLSGKNLLDFNPGYKGGYAVLNWRLEDLPEAVQKGYVTQSAADWATTRVRVKMPDGSMGEVTRHQLGSALLKQGLNASRMIDALYKDAVRRIPLIGEPWHKVIGPYNRWLFDQYSSGLMLQTAVQNFERLHEKFPEKRVDLLARDVVRQMNIEFGNMGRQGIFKNPTFRDLSQIVLLAPMWREGIVMKELSTYANLARAAGHAAVGDLAEARYRMSQPVLRSMARGLGAYFILTQVLNLITRKQFTWQNEEKDHKLDAYIPTSKDEGFWLSPMSVFMEMTHDTIRLLGSKPRAHDALIQIGMNALGPVGKAAHVLSSGEDEFGRSIGSTPRIWGKAAEQLAPLPLSFGAPARAIGHRLAPNLIAPNRPGALTRQGMGWLGLKVQPSESVLVRMQKQATQYAKDNNLKPESGFELQPTDEPSYSALRAALRNDDRGEAQRIFRALRQTHPLKIDKKGNVVDDPILKAMGVWARRPLTGSYDAEIQFVNSLTDKELDFYSQAQDERLKMLNQYIDWYIQNSGE